MQINILISICFLILCVKQPVTRHRDSVAVEFNESLTLVATLFRDSNGQYQEKKGKLVVRLFQTLLFRVSSYKGLGIARLDLHSFANNNGPQNLTLPLTQCPDGATIEVELTARYIGDIGEVFLLTYDYRFLFFSLLFFIYFCTCTLQVGEINDETMSMYSEGSDGGASSVGCAADFHGFATEVDESEFQDGRTEHELGEPVKAEDGFYEIGLSPNSSPLTMPSSSINSRGASDRSTRLRSASEGQGGDGNSKETNRFGYNGGKKDDSSLIGSSTGLTAVNTHKATTSFRTNSAASDRIAELEKQLFEQEARHRADEAEFKTRIETVTRNLNYEIDLLKADLSKATAAAKAKTALSASSASPTTSTSAEIAAIDAELQCAKRALTRAYEEAAQAKRERDKHVDALEAAIVTTEREAALRSAKEIELDDLLNELIETKVQCAEFEAEVDDERVKVMLLRRRLQQYAERVAALEVLLAKSAEALTEACENQEHASATAAASSGGVSTLPPAVHASGWHVGKKPSTAAGVATSSFHGPRKLISPQKLSLSSSALNYQIEGRMANIETDSNITIRKVPSNSNLLGQSGATRSRSNSLKPNAPPHAQASATDAHNAEFAELTADRLKMLDDTAQAQPEVSKQPCKVS